MTPYLTETMQGERRICWITEDSAGGPGPAPIPGRTIGHANLLIMGDIGVVEVMVHPAARHQGVGRALVGCLARRAYSEGLSSLGVEAVGGTPAVGFWESLGFRRAYVEMRNILDLSRVDWPRVEAMARSVPAGYRVEYHPGGLPPALLEPYAAAKAVRREADGGEVELRPSSYDAKRLAESLDTLGRPGMLPYLVLAVPDRERVGSPGGGAGTLGPGRLPGRVPPRWAAAGPAGALRGRQGRAAGGRRRGGGAAAQPLRREAARREPGHAGPAGHAALPGAGGA